MFLYPLIEHMFWIFVRIALGDSNKYPKHMFFLVLNTIILHSLLLIVTSKVKVS